MFPEPLSFLSLCVSVEYTFFKTSLECDVVEFVNVGSLGWIKSAVNSLSTEKTFKYHFLCKKFLITFMSRVENHLKFNFAQPLTLAEEVSRVCRWPGISPNHFEKPALRFRLFSTGSSFIMKRHGRVTNQNHICLRK